MEGLFLYFGKMYKYRTFMIITKAYKIRLYPTKGQQVFFNKDYGVLCKTHHDRDINAAINIKNEGLRLLDKQSTVEVTETGSAESKVQYIASNEAPMLVENPTMDESLLDIKSSDSMK